MLEMLWKFVSRKFVRWTLRSRWKIWGFTLKKLKLGWDPPCRRSPKKKIVSWKRSKTNQPNHDFLKFSRCNQVIHRKECLKFCLISEFKKSIKSFEILYYENKRILISVYQMKICFFTFFFCPLFCAMKEI